MEKDMIKIVVKNVPPHNGGDQGEDLICSLTKDCDQRLKEISHINDVGEEGECSQPRDKNGYYFQHRIYVLPEGTEKLPSHLYMWVDYREKFSVPRKIERNGKHCGYPAYYYSKTRLMSCRDE